MTAELLAVLFVLACALAPASVVGVRAVRRQVLLYRMQKLAAHCWQMGRDLRAAGVVQLERQAEWFEAQAEHLDRHIRMARDPEAGE